MSMLYLASSISSHGCNITSHHAVSILSSESNPRNCTPGPAYVSLTCSTNAQCSSRKPNYLHIMDSLTLDGTIDGKNKQIYLYNLIEVPSMPQCSKLLSQLYFIGVCFLVLLKSKHDKQTTNVRARSQIPTFQLLFPIFNRTIEPSPSRSGSILSCGWCGEFMFPILSLSPLTLPVTTMQCTVSHHHAVHCEKCEKQFQSYHDHCLRI